MAWPGLELFSIGRRMHSTGFCVPWMVSVSCTPLGMVHSVVCLRSPVQFGEKGTAENTFRARPTGRSAEVLPRSRRLARFYACRKLVEKVGFGGRGGGSSHLRTSLAWWFPWYQGK